RGGSRVLAGVVGAGVVRHDPRLALADSVFRPAEPHRLLRARQHGRPGSRRRPERPGPGHDPAQARRPACGTRTSLLTRVALGARPTEMPLLALSPKTAGLEVGMSCFVCKLLVIRRVWVGSCGAGGGRD